MKRTAITILVFLSALSVQAASAPPNFSGNWSFDPAQSRNIGMMAQAKIQTTVTQSNTRLMVDDKSSFNGQEDTQHTSYDLTGKPVTNTSMMAGQVTTRSHWQGTRMITEWESAGAIAGTTTKRVETRYLSADGLSMYVESARPGKDAMVMVFKKDK
jgi:hypothetical protein